MIRSHEEAPVFAPISPEERTDCEKRAGRPLPTDEDVLNFLADEREFQMREQLFYGGFKSFR